MTESLRLILDDIVAVGRKSQPEITGNITVDSTLLALAGAGFASFVEVEDRQWI